MKCISCGAENPAGLKFCNECAAPFGRGCSKCGFENAPTAKFCGECAAPLGATTTTASAKHSSASLTRIAETSAPENLEGERKTVTALFADLKGSTALMETLDPEEARAIIDPALRIMIDAVKRYDGYVVQSTGDGIFALFGAPIAHEDHPQRALYAALQMQQQLRKHGQRRAAETNVLEARVGVNTGEVVVRSVETGGKVEYTPIGHTANLASRLQTLAPAGSIAVSEHTRKLCEGYFELQALGPMAARGISEPIKVYEVTGLGALRTHFEQSARRGLTKFVGRERELEQMAHALDLAIGGHGQVVAVMAEAGTGKSRLFHEFKAKLPASSRLLEAYSVSHGKASAWLPVLELLRKYFGFADVDDAAARREKIRCTLDALDPALQDTLPYLFGLLSIVEGPDLMSQMDPQIKRRRTLEAIKRIVMRESLKQPLVVIFEDLHWIDEHTQGLLDLMADSIAHGRVLLLVNYRPEYRHEWGSKSHYIQIGLKPLARENADELLSALLEDAVELKPLKQLIIERTGGNPFFIEEIVQSLFDDGTLVRNGTVKMTRALSQLRLPPTVQGILAARIDGLSAPQKELLQTLAVLGRESTPGLIRLVANLAEAQLERLIADLRADEFIYEQPAATSVEYVFKHALTQEVAYNSLLIERRKQIHEHAGHALESIFANQLDDHLTELAHHYRHSEHISKAVEYLGRAGQQAMQRSAHTDAISGLNAAIDLLQTLPDSPERIQRELPLQLALGPVLSATKGWAAPEVERAYTRARGLCERLGETPESFWVLFGLYAVHFVRGEMRPAYDLAEQLLWRAQCADDPMLLMFAHLALGFTTYQMGELLLARQHLEMAISLYDRERHRQLAVRRNTVDSEVQCLGYLAYTLWTLGYPDQALKRANEAVGLAQALCQPFSLVFAEQNTGFLHLYRREARAAQENGETVIALCAEHGFTELLAFATVLRGAAMANQERFEEGIAQIQEGLAPLRASGSALARPTLLTQLAQAYMETGRLDEGLRALAEALAAGEENQDHQDEPERHRVKGELLLRRSDSNAAEAQNCFERAIEIARKQSAKSWELRATTSLAQLLSKQGHHDEARTMLACIYGWFTEGFDTADLKDAKALLTELGD
jgi:predicted ATPase/class 3 adenylate cyclase